MPHAFIKTKTTPLELIETWEEKSFQLGNIRIKIRKGYSNPDNIPPITSAIVMTIFNPATRARRWPLSGTSC